MDDFIIRALIGGSGVAAVAGPLGAFVVWRRMAFFGGTLSHSALLGVALGFLLGINLNVGIFAVTAVVAVSLVALGRRAHLSDDTLLGILAHASLALGLLALALMEGLRVDLMSYLFGDILAVSRGEMVSIMGPSGCGKTTLLNCFSGLDEIDGGQVLIDGVALHDLPDDERSDYRARRMGFAFQLYNLLQQ